MRGLTADSMEVGMRRHASCLLALAVALTVCCTAAPAHGDSIPIIITSGSFTFRPSIGAGGPLTLFGTNGFSFIGGGQFGSTGPGFLSPGVESSFHAFFCCNDLPGIATFGGETFTKVGSASSANQVIVDFESAPFTVPPIGASATIIA